MIYPPWESVAKGELRQNFPTEDKSHNLQVDKHNMSGFYHSHNLHVILIDLVTTTVNSMFNLFVRSMSKLRRISGLSNLERVPPTRTSSGTLSILVVGRPVACSRLLKTRAANYSSLILSTVSQTC